MPRTNLDGLVFSFRESMSGRLNEADIRFDVQVRIPDLGRFLWQRDHPAELSGTIEFAPLGGTFPIRQGRFQLFSMDPETGVRQMVYSFQFTARDGQTYCLRGHKLISDDRGRFDVIEDMTRLYTTLHRGEDKHGPVYGTGELRFRLQDSPSLLASIKVEGARSWIQERAARTAFASFAWGALRDEYLKELRPFYDTRYENLVLSGRLRKSAGGEEPFFLVSGVHDRGFPWGDSELFWDVLLAIGDAGNYRRYCITDRILEGLHLDLRDGVYRYQGPVFALRDGYSASFFQMKKKAANLEEMQAEIHIAFEATPLDAVAFPFPLVGSILRKLSSRMGKTLTAALPGENPLGIHITPHAVTVRSGSIQLGPAGERWEILPEHTHAECESGTFRNIKEPTLLYGYLCAVRPDRKSARVQILSRTLRNERHEWIKDRLDACLGFVFSRLSSAEILVENGVLLVKPLPPAGAPRERAILLRKCGDPVLEVNNDHFPTAVFQRRIVDVQEPDGRHCLALEEDMSMMRLEALNTDRQVTVASIYDTDKRKALERALDATDFDALVESRLLSSGKSRQSFAVVIKPNFMFAYDKRDRSTYTDPALVHHLIGRLRARGFESIRVVEAQSTYGEFFDRRSVREMAAYLGYDGSAGYEVVDMTLDADTRQQLGPHLGEHPVSHAWRTADFRISFAKNKTHAYSYYTLTLKNIYGALPLANKFKEYHCKRDIYHTTLEYLAAFPVHYGLIDAWLSADGPFGVFADPDPNETRTIIGGADLVAVDWIGASKMGIDPLISPFMQLAVKAFGKPEIRLVGDANPYRPWLNVPVALTLLTHKGMDAEFHFGNLLYNIAAQMDETHFRHKSRSLPIRLLRRATVPLRRTFFLRTGENPSLTNRLASALLYRLGY